MRDVVHHRPVSLDEARMGVPNEAWAWSVLPTAPLLHRWSTEFELRRRDRAGQLVEPFLQRRARDVWSEQLFASDALLPGRVTYGGLAAAWPSKEEIEGEFGVRMNRLPKFVASRGLQTPLEWNATLLEGDPGRTFLSREAASW